MNKKIDDRVTEDLAKLFSDQLSEQDADRIGKAMEADGRYESEFVETANTLLDLPALTDDEDIRRLLDEPLSDNALDRGKRRHWPVFAAAAGVLLAILVGVQLWPTEAVQGESNVLRYVTRIGEQKTVELPDGSVLTLNTGTELLVDVASDRRRIIMNRGEAFFDVASDPEKPFTVDLDGKFVTVLGTQFNIRKQPNQFTLALVEGMVSLHNSDDELLSNSKLLGSSGDKIVELNNPGQRRVEAGWVVTYHKADNQLSAHQQQDLSQAYNWTTGFLEFEEKSLVKVVNELNRYTGKKILIDDSSIMDLEVYAGIRIDQIDQALRALEKSLPIKVVRDFDQILIVRADDSK